MDGTAEPQRELDAGVRGPFAYRSGGQEEDGKPE
jgi:hypothetical protein